MHFRRLLVITVMFALASSLALAQTGPDAKINQKLISALIDSQHGTAPLFVVFAERTPLAAAHSIPDWAARGRFVVERLQATADRSQKGIRGYLQAQGVAYTPF